METPVNTAPRCGGAVLQGAEHRPVRARHGRRGGVLVPLRRLRHRPQHADRRGLLGAAAVWVWFLRRSARPPLLFLAALGVFGAFTVWSGISVLWSFGPDLTWVSFNLTAFYLAVVAVLGLTSARGLQLWTVAYGYLAVAAAVGVYAFLGKGLPAVVTHAHTYSRLDSPVGYWNVLALMMVMGLCVALADRRGPRDGCGAAHAGRRRGRPHVLHVLLHLLPRRLGRARGGAGAVLRLHDDAARELHLARGGGHAGGARALAAPRPGDAVRRDHGRRPAHAAGRRPAALGDRGAAGRRPASSWRWRCCTGQSAGHAGRPSPPGQPYWRSSS